MSSEGGFITLDICGTCGPGLPTDAAYLAAALRPTTWLQSDHPRLLAMAAAARNYDVSDTRKMEVLLQRAIPYLEEADFNGHYSALDTIERRKGDCTEAAVLLAALGRAAGIPTRVASGVSYSRQSYHGVSNAFIPHSWVVAYVDGRWRSFDLALREFDSAHIALTIGDGDPRDVTAALNAALTPADDAHRAALATGLKLLADTDLRARIGSVHQPVRLIHGAEDRLMPAAAAEWLADALPDGRLSVFKDCGHAPLLSRPADCAALIAAFATEATAASATTAADH